jgi:hypothetical protein
MISHKHALTAVRYLESSCTLAINYNLSEIICRDAEYENYLPQLDSPHTSITMVATQSALRQSVVNIN